MPLESGQVACSLPFQKIRVLCVRVLVTPISESPIRNDWLRLEVPYTPGEIASPLKCAVKLTLVCCGQ